MQVPSGERIMERKPPLKGPNGCSTADECRKVCTENPELCKDFKANTGAMPGMQGGTSGKPMPPCNSPEECQKLREQMMHNGMPQAVEGQRLPTRTGIDAKFPPPSMESGPFPSETTTAEPVSVITPSRFLASVIKALRGLFRQD